MEDFTENLYTIKLSAEQKAGLLQLMDMYGTEIIVKQFMAYIPEKWFAIFSVLILGLERELWIRSLPHGPSSDNKPTNLFGCYPDPITDIRWERYRIGPGGVPISRGLDLIRGTTDPLIEQMKVIFNKSQRRAGSIQGEGILRKAAGRIWQRICGVLKLKSTVTNVDRSMKVL